MSRIWMPGGAGGADLDVVTAAAGDILAGKVIVGPDGEPLTGVLTLTGSAADSQVLSGKTYYSTDAKTKRTGTMANQGAVAPAGLNAGGSYTIPAGYHNGSGKVIANSLASQTGVQSGKTAAGAGHILTGYEAWVNGGRVTGTMANQGAVAPAGLNAGGSYTIPAGYHNGSGKVIANSLASQTDATAAAGDILTGKTAWVKGNKVTGTMATMAGQTVTPGSSQQTISCSGKKMTGNIVINAIPSSYVATSSWPVFNNGTLAGGVSWVPEYAGYNESGALYGKQTGMSKKGTAVQYENAGSYGSLPLIYKRNLDLTDYYNKFSLINYTTGTGYIYPLKMLLLSKSVDISKYQYINVTYWMNKGDKGTTAQIYLCPSDKKSFGLYKEISISGVVNGLKTYKYAISDFVWNTSAANKYTRPAGTCFIGFAAKYESTALPAPICLYSVSFSSS